MLPNACDPSVEKHLKGLGAISGIRFHPDAGKVATCSLDRTLTIYNIASSGRAYRFFGHKDAVLDLDYAPSGNVVASASRDRSVRILVPTIQGESLDFRAHTAAVRSVQFSPDGEKVIFIFYLLHFSISGNQNLRKTNRITNRIVKTNNRFLQ